MLETIQQWVAATDTAILNMGPAMVIALGLLGGFGIAQALKFPIAEAIQHDRLRDWTIRAVAMLATLLCLRMLGDLPFAIELVVALSQPLAYTVVMRAARHYWPWLEAGRVVGSAAPSDEAVQARAMRKAGFYE